MQISRRDFIKTSGLAAVVSSLPIALTAKATAQSRPPAPRHIRIKHFGANIKFWMFDRSVRIRREQIRQVQRWGISKLRDNQPYVGIEWYDLNHAAAVAQDCLNVGIEYTISGADDNVGLENLVTAEQYNALLQRYNNNESFARTAISAIGIGCNNTTIRNYLLEHILATRAVMPAGVRMEPFNGPELDGFIPWNLYDEEFRSFVQSIGFVVPGGQSAQQINLAISENYQSFRNQAKAIWGSPWLEKSNHVYEYNGMFGIQPYYTPWQPELYEPVITEFGVSRFEVPNLAESFQTIPIRMIIMNADAGVLVTDATGSYNITEMFLHEPLDSRFADFWINGDTRPLWNASQYRRILQNGPPSRNTWAEHSGVLLDPSCAVPLLTTMQTLRTTGAMGRIGLPGGRGPRRP